MELYYKKVPKTTPERYISGYEALNVVDENGLTADWHPLTFWTSTTQEEIPLYENPLLKEKGISFRKIPFSEEMVYIANFARAIADLIYHEYETHPCLFRNIAEDFLSKEERAELFGYLLEIRKEKEIDEFLIQEFPKEYYEFKYRDLKENAVFAQRPSLRNGSEDNDKVYTGKELVDKTVNSFSQQRKAQDLYDLGYLIKKYPGEFSREQLLSIIDNINYKGMDSLEYSLRLEMKEHHLAKIDPATYIIELYERCSCRLEELQEEQEWNIGFSFDKGFKL